jgi:hypothetical protein
MEEPGWHPRTGPGGRDRRPILETLIDISDVSFK